MTSEPDTIDPPQEKRKRRGKGAGKAAPTVVLNGANIPDDPPKIGAPTTYTEEIADRICAWVAKGRSLRSFCLLEETPEMQTVYNWQDANPAFFARYARAKDRGMDVMAELATDEATANMPPEQVQAARLALDARKWYVSKIAPKRYGDRIETKHEISGPNGGPITFAVLLSQALERPEIIGRLDDEELAFLQERIVPKLCAPSTANDAGDAEFTEAKKENER